jgi:hypothetical protein
MIIEELATLNNKWNLRLNKKKSEILTSAELEEINGVKMLEDSEISWSEGVDR